MDDAIWRPGEFCWFELNTTEPEAAKAFYGRLFGWTFRDEAAPDGSAHSIAFLGDKPVGGLHRMGEPQRAAGVPPHWMPYAKVADVDEAVQRAVGLAAKVIVPPFDVTDQGRTAVLLDAVGGVITLWQARKLAGVARLPGAPGTVAWVQLAARDVAEASRFYSALFGWTPKNQPIGPTQFTTFHLGELLIAGLATMLEGAEHPPAAWMVYFAVDDCARALAIAETAGGQVLFPPMDMPGVGRFSMLADPQGAVVGVVQLAPTPR